MAGHTPKQICDLLSIEQLPRPLLRYLFCSPELDGKFRCLPQAGGLDDQRFVDVLSFNIIESRLFELLGQRKQKHMKEVQEMKRQLASRQQRVRR